MFMKSSSLFLAFALVFLAPACQKSEISDQPAAEVSDTGATVTADATPSSTAPAAGAVTTNVVKEKSRIEWVAGKVTRDHNGQFRNFDGTLEYAGGKPSRISFDIDLNSIEADDEKLTGHLKSPDFFDVAKYP